MTSTAPIGVSFETLSSDPAGAIKIDGRPLPDTSNRSGIFLAVVNRTNRAELRCGTAARSFPGVDHLLNILNSYAAQKNDNYLAVVSGAHGLPDKASVDRLSDLAVAVGGSRFSADETQQLLAGQPFSIVGIAGGTSGAAWTDVGHPGDGVAGDITGYLQQNSSTGRYDYVSPETPSFDTQVGGAQPGRNTIRVGQNLYTAALPAGASDGFQIVAVSSTSLQLFRNVAVPTNGPGNVPVEQDILRQTLEYFTQPATDGRPPLVFIQSIGHPQGESPAWANPGLPYQWDGAATWIERLGGTRLAFNSLGGTADYTLVGSATSGPTAVEASSVLGQPGPLVGVLARTHDYGFQPLNAGPPGDINLEFIQMAYQAPQPFPAFSGGEALAETYIAHKLFLCPKEKQSCSIRPLYYQSASENWLADAGSVRAFSYPRGAGFTDNDFERVKRQLVTEFGYVAQVKSYFAALQAPFGTAKETALIDVKTIGNEIFDAVNPPPADNSTSWWLGFTSKVLAVVGAIAPPPGKNVAAGLAAAFALASYLTASDGTPQLADVVKVKADALAGQLSRRLIATSNSLTGEEKIFLSDYGKLKGVWENRNKDPWVIVNDPKATNAIILAARQWFAQQLVPVAYPYLIRATPPPIGPTTANGLYCGSIRGHPWASEPASAQIFAIEGWDKNGAPPIRTTYFFAGQGLGYVGAFNTPSAKVTKELFDPVKDPTTGPLGLNKLAFLSPRVFPLARYKTNPGPMFYANDNEAHCHLNYEIP
ncbi:MAG TPA: hypothetical protein VIY26_05755 [Acidimicrobiales bacterium]